MINKLDTDVSTFAARLRSADSFTRTVAEWADAPIDYVSLLHEHRPVAPEHAAVLDVPAGTDAMHRCGHLEVVGLGTSRQVVADVRAVVVTHRLPRDAQHDLAARKLPLGLILARHGVRRENTVNRVDEVDHNGSQVLLVAGTLTVGDVPVALVHEVVYRQLFEAPQQITAAPLAP